ncbi:NAD-dependent epimerase/dehydratase family protein, partial [Gammaproteobacteria bacterium]|nr:NAD-dependent epimerase/dehydratase family protein [Gammaproteobacteria bacterium]
MDLNEKIYVAGHLGMVGSSILRKLQNDGYQNLLVRDRKELDLTDQVSVKKFFKAEQPDKVYLCAAKVG